MSSAVTSDQNEKSKVGAATARPKPVDGMGGNTDSDTIEESIQPESSETVAESWIKKIDMPSIPYGKVISNKELESLNNVAQYVDNTTSKIDAYRIEQEESLQDRYTHMIKKVERDSTKKYVAEIETFQQNCEQYFKSIEAHCAKITTEALKLLADDIPDENKLIASIKSVSGMLKNESQVVLKVSSSQVPEAENFASQKNWLVEEDRELSSGDCRFEVPMGSFLSSFNTRLDLVLESLEHDA